MARPGMARNQAGPGKARLGLAWHGKARNMARPGLAVQGMARHGWARQGTWFVGLITQRYPGNRFLGMN
jgi:hypothetical protein